MKTTLEIPDELFRQTKATAALRGESLKELVTRALREHLEAPTGRSSRPLGWRRVFGRAQEAEVEEIDAIVAQELGRVDSDEWR